MAMTKAELIAAAKAQWAATEASVAVAANGNFETAAAGEWPAGDCYRHLIDTMHKIPEAMEQILRGAPMTALRPGDEEGIQDFKSLNARMLPVELNTAHGIVWMALQKLTEPDLDRPMDLGGNAFTVGGLLELVLIGHEAAHAEQALKSAGVI